ncbi:carbohydrate kinase [Streptacidiphilus sp. N1-12]|uniref:Carbohydrate kinase n=2 Tax=Streptacidiphilus alkalitolerans TaxID=3342712 RepID=A0ABV6WB47_9ACTN
MTDFLVIGECVADIVRTPGQPDVPHPGGSPANVAYGLARLGRDTALLTQLGADPMGALIAAHLRSAGVTLLAEGRPDVRTPTAVVTIGPDGGATYSFDIAWTLGPVEPLPTAPPHVHLGSIAAVTAPGAASALAVVEGLRPEASVSYDPNIRAALLGDRAEVVRQVERCVALSDLVKASDEDLAWLYPGDSHQAVAARWLALGAAAVLVTLGGDGAVGWTGTARAAVPGVPTTVVDTVGAGDSFMSAVLDALADRELLGRAARPALAALDAAVLAAVLGQAAAAAAITVSRAGANPPDRAELRAGQEPGQEPGRQPAQEP